MSDDFPIPAQRIVATLASLFEAQGDRDVSGVLRSGAANIEETNYDNWNGGTYYYRLNLELPVATYARIEGRLEDLEELVRSKLQTALRTTGNQILSSVVITPAFEDVDVNRGQIAAEDVERLWTTGMFRLFLSHTSQHKVAVSILKQQLATLGVSAFVAHEDIEPSLEWQAEIERALGSMDAMAALLTSDFHASYWTDQEIGIAVGRGALVIPVRLPETPYGFIAKHQGLRGDLAAPGDLASRVVDILLLRPRTSDAMRTALVSALELADSFATSKAVTSKLEHARPFDLAQLARIRAAASSNSQVSDSFGVPERLHEITGPAPSPQRPPADDLDDLPF